MKLTFSTHIACTRERVWPLIADPDRHAEWNPKVRVTRRAGTGPVRPGERFSIIGHLGGRDQAGEVETILADTPSCVKFRHTVEHQGVRRSAIETYELVDRRDGVKLTQTIDLTDAGIPRLIRWLMKFIRLFGKPVGESPLKSLKALAEQMI